MRQELEAKMAPGVTIFDPLVSIVIPAHNAEAFIAQTIESIASQTHRNVEVIVVDDGSTDRTAQVVRKYQPPVRYYLQEQAGVSAARNRGIAMASGEFLCFIDADDLLTPDRIESQLGFLGRHPDAGLVFCNYRNFNDFGPHPKTHFETCSILQAELNGRAEIVLENANSYLAQENFGIAGSFMVRKELLELEPGFETQLKGGEDFHFYFRLSRHSKVGIIGKVGMLRRLHSRNVTSDTASMLSGGIRSSSMLRASEEDKKIRRLLDRRIANFWSDLARWNADHGNYDLAIWQEIVALRSDLRPLRIAKLFRNVARTILMAMRLHHPARN